MRIRALLAAVGAFVLGVYVGTTSRAIGERLAYTAAHREQAPADGITDEV